MNDRLTFTQFCELMIGRPLYTHEKNMIVYIETHPDAKIIMPARGSCRMSVEARYRLLKGIFDNMEVEQNEDEQLVSDTAI